MNLPFNQAVARLSQNEERIDTFTHGGPADTYPTRNGAQVPSIRKFLTDLRADIVSETGPLYENLYAAEIQDVFLKLSSRSIFDKFTQDERKAIIADVNAPVAHTAFQSMFADLEASPDTNPYLKIPAGVYYFDKCAEMVLRSPGVNRTFTLEIAEGAKFIHTDANKYRYRVIGEYNGATNTPNIQASFGAVGDVYLCVAPNDNMNVGLIRSVNVGDALWKGPNGWQKILAEPKYRYQAWNALSNTDESNNLTLISGIGEEGDTIIVSKGGTANIDGVSDWAIGDEAYFCLGKWRKKTVRGGTYKGTWNAATNTPALSNSNGSAGDWYVVTGVPAFAPIGGTGLGESIVFQPGDKIWCIAPGLWRKCYASPALRGTWDLNGTYMTKFYPANTISRPALADQGAYGDLWHITETGPRTVAGASSVWSRGECLYRGPSGFERIAQDPNWNRGIFRFIHDDKTRMVVKGTAHFVSRDDGRGSDYAAGWAVRSHSLYRPNHANYLFQNDMLVVEDILSESDNSNAGLSQFASGIWEGIWETRNLYLPVIMKASLRTTQSDGGARLTSLTYQPRRSAFGIRHIDSYVPKCFSLHLNGDFGCAYSVESEVWDVEKSSWEGGEICVDGAAGVVDIVSLRHGLRMVPAFPEPSFFIIMKDTNYSRYGVRIHGHQGVDVVMGVPILPGDGGSVPIIARPSFCFIEDGGAVTIHDGIPTGSQYIDAQNFSSLVATRGAVFGVTLDAINFSQMKAGVVFDLHHNNNGNVQALNQGPTINPTVRLRGCSHLGVDTAGRKLVFGRTEYLDGMEERLRIQANGGIDFRAMTSADAVVMKNGQVLVMSDTFDHFAFGDRLVWRRRSDGVPIFSIDAGGLPRFLQAPIVVSDVMA